MKIQEQLQRLKKGTPIWIHWIDSCGGGSGWRWSGDFNKRARSQNLRMRTLGFVINVSEESITTAGSRQVSLGPGGNFNFSDDQTIPIVAIKRWGFLYLGDLATDVPPKGAIK